MNHGISFIKQQRTPSDTDETIFDIDVTPIMNMFIILIPFLVSMAVFTHLSIIEFSLPPNVNAGLDPAEGKPTLKVTVVIAPDYLAITYGDSMIDSVARVNNEYDYPVFSERLTAYRLTHDTQDEVIIAVRDEILFKNVVTIMDICRDAGFGKTALSSAAVNLSLSPEQK